MSPQEVSDLLACLRRHRLWLTHDGTTLRVCGTAGALPAALASQLDAANTELLQLPCCPFCQGILEPDCAPHGRTCWRCEVRLCRSCNEPTGSVLRPTCLPCAFKSAREDRVRHSATANDAAEGV